MNKKFIKGAMCLSMISSMALTNVSLIKPINAIASQITGTTHTGSFNVDSLTLQPGETTSSVNVNWYAPEGTSNSMIQFGDQTYQVEAKDLTSPTKVDTSKYKDTGKKVCKVTVNGLQADTQYTYYISNDNGNTWSNAYTYTTPKNDSFKFGFTSDPQIKENKETDSKGWNPSDGTNQTGWATMMSELEEQGVNLVVSAGDQVEDQSWGKSSEYDSFFAPTQMTSIPYAPAVGNHDRHYMFADHFNLPHQMDSLEEVKTTFRGQNSGTSQSHGNYIQATDEEIAKQTESNGVTPNAEGQYDFVERREMETKGNYYYLYNNVLFVTLNTGAYPGGNDEENANNASVPSASKGNEEAEAIVKNFRTTLQAATNEYQNQYQWLVVTHHKSTQTVAKHAADSDIENYVDAGFESLMDDFKVDFVLGGHDHVYSRSYVLKGGKRVSERLDTINDPQGTIYLTGNCCSDMQYNTPFEKLDKNNNADFPVLANGKKGSQAYMEGTSLPYGNQEWNQEYSPSYAVFDVKDNKMFVKVYNLDGDSQNPDSKEIDSFTVTKKSDGGSKITGFENANALLSLQQTGRYDSGITNVDGGVIEIVDYNNQTGWAYAVNGQSGKLVAIAIKDMETKDKVDLLDGNDIDIKSIVEKEDSSFTYGDMTSVSVSHDGKYLALAIQADDYRDNGRVAVFECHEDGTIGLLKIVEVGVQPDMVVYTNDDTQILTANEGEPRKGYTSTDPKGTISVINTKTFEVNNVGFEDFDSQEERQKLVDQGIVIKKGTNPSEDFEPEYIAVSDTKAYITLQENNAIAVLDLKTQKIENVMSVGYEDYSKVSVDIDKKDGKYAPQTYESLRGIRMPDALSVYTIDGVDYVITANEGDSRKWGDYTNEKEVNFGKGKTSPTGKITSENSGLTGKVVFFDSSDYDGLDNDKDYLFGGRSSTIFKVEGNTMKEVFTTGNDFEAVTAKYIPDHFNCSNDDITIDDRSGKKGPESESVTIGKIGEKTFAFVGLERVGGIVVYDITNPEKATYVNYINSRDFTSDIAGDDSPEGMKFISSDQSKTGKPQLLVAYEVSGTLGAYDLILNSSSENGDKKDEPKEDPKDDKKEDKDNKQDDNKVNDDKIEDKKDENTIISDTNNKGNNDLKDNKINLSDSKNSLKENKETIKQNKVKTGDNTTIGFYVITLLMSLFAGVFFIKKHKKAK